MKPARTLTIGFGFVLALVGAVAQSRAADVTIDARTVFQRMDGFGAVFDDPHVYNNFNATTQRAQTVLTTAQQDAVLDRLYVDLQTTVSNVPAAANGQKSVTLPISTESQFFRLKRPREISPERRNPQHSPPLRAFQEKPRHLQSARGSGRNEEWERTPLPSRTADAVEQLQRQFFGGRLRLSSFE